MNRLLDIADQYIRESDWKTIAVLKFCLLSIGMIVGMLLPDRIVMPAMIICAIVFVLTYIPLMAKLIRIALRKNL
ncbi:MAG: permease of phosphate ABC transporter [Clostridia bacterium]|nr:permease of phosphate ABC transporter [Clostridia bacterium]